MASANFTIFLLPKTCTDKGIWDQIVFLSKEFRLQSLKIAPRAFSSSYEQESQFDWAIWENRLKNPRASTFVAFSNKVAQSTEQLKLPKLLEQTWSGMLVLVGPLDRTMTSASPTLTPTELSQHDGARNNFLDFQLNAMFVLPETRRSGLGMGLIEAAIAHGKTTSKDEGVTSTRFTVLVNSENYAAIHLYQKAGFKAMVEEDVAMGAGERHSEKKSTLMELWI